MKEFKIKEILDNMSFLYEGGDGRYYYDVYYHYNDFESSEYLLNEDKSKVFNIIDNIFFDNWEEFTRQLRIEFENITDLDYYEYEDLLIENIVYTDDLFNRLNKNETLVQFTINTNDEWNSEFHNNDIVLETVIGADYPLWHNVDMNNKYLLENNSIIPLIESQGYKIGDLNDIDKVNKSKFLKSIIREYENGYHDGELIFTKRMGITDALYFQGKLIDFCYEPNIDKNITIDKNTKNLGLFNSCYGSGSLLNIELEKPVTYNTKNLYINYGTYQARDVYGF